MPIDRSRLPTPQVLAQVDYATELASLLAELQALDPTLTLTPSDPAHRVLMVCAYLLTNKTQEFNDRAKGLLLAFAQGGDLDHIGITYHRTQRLVIDAGNPGAVPPVDPIYESDDDYLARILIAEDAYSTAGPDAAYVYHASSAHGDIKDVSVVSPTFERIVLTPEQEAALPAGAQLYVPLDDAGLADPTPLSVVVTTLSRQGDGTPDQALLDAVDAALSRDVRPITDEVVVRGASIIQYTVNATITVYADANQIYTKSVAERALQKYVDSHHELGHAPTELGLRAALKVAGVHNVVLNDTGNGTDMTVDLVVPKTAAAYCLGITVAIGGSV